MHYHTALACAHSGHSLPHLREAEYFTPSLTGRQWQSCQPGSQNPLLLQVSPGFLQLWWKSLQQLSVPAGTCHIYHDCWLSKSCSWDQFLWMGKQSALVESSCKVILQGAWMEEFCSYFGTIYHTFSSKVFLLTSLWCHFHFGVLCSIRIFLSF